MYVACNNRHTDYTAPLVCTNHPDVETSIWEALGFKHHSAVAPELNELLGHVTAIPIGTFKHALELLKMLQSVAALLQFSLASG